ncbi:MAG: glycosyltransferase family 2 protein, partial [Proteobacteria bacterium]
MKATVLLPTTAGRGALIRYSAGSVLRQTIRDLELFIVGDGVDEETRIVARELCEHDSRVRFVDRPKHARRGETYRHELLTSEASGDIVCYLCDRDLMLSNHVAESLRNLESYDFSGTGIYMMQVDGSIKAATINLLGEIQGDDRMRFGQLSRNAHT